MWPAFPCAGSANLMLFSLEGQGASMLDILKDYQALIAGLLGFGAVVWSIQNAKSNIISRIKSDDARELRQRNALEASAYEYYINASQKLVTRCALSLEAIAGYTKGLEDSAVSRPHFANLFGKLSDALERRAARPMLIDSDLAALYPLIDSETRRAISEHELYADTVDISESVLIKNADDILKHEGGSWGNNERETVQASMIILASIHLGVSIYAVNCYANALNYFFEKYIYPNPHIKDDEVFSHRKDVIERLAEAADEVYEIWCSEDAKECVEAIRQLHQKIEADWSAPRQRRGFFDRKLTPPRQFPEIPDSVLMAASKTLAEASLHHRRKRVAHLQSS